MTQTPDGQSITHEQHTGTLGKLHTIDSLVDIIRAERSDGRRVVHCHGVFDLLHLGHIRHFQQARTFGDVLVVTLTPDRFVDKGEHRPAFSENHRAEAIAALNIVDYVAINQWPTAVETLRLLQPDVYCKGSEYRQRQMDAESNMLPEISMVEALNIQMAFTDDIVFSSSQLLNRHFSPFPPETNAWLSEFRKHHDFDGIIGYLDKMCDLKVLVIGEAIIDEYVFVYPIGKSTKDPVLACQYHATEAFAGGSLAVANHLADFCDKVDLITCLGESDRRENYIRSELKPQVNPLFITKQGAPTIIKRRFVEQYSQNKLFELYIMDDKPLQGENEQRLVESIEQVVTNYDLVITTDYGHGMLTPAAIKSLCNHAQFLSVNAQSNAGNHGFNPISKYRRADYVCLSNHEIAIETRMREGDMRVLMREVNRSIDCNLFTTTLGREGSLHYDADEGFTEVPALATSVKDRVGAGDAVLAITSPLVALSAPWDIVGFVGNVAGALMVSELGNRRPINKISLCKYIISLLK